MAVDQQKIEAFDAGLDHFRDPAPQVESVGVPPDRIDRRNRLQLEQQAGIPHIPRMEDPVDVFEYLEDLRTQEAVGVADYSEAQEEGYGLLAIGYWPEGV